MQVVRAGIRALRSSYSPSIPSHCFNGGSSTISVIRRGRGGVSIADRGNILGFIAGARVFSQSAVCSSDSFLDKEEISTRVVDLLKSISFIDPSKVSPKAHFKDDLQLDILDNVEVVMAAEEEFAIDIPENEADKFTTTAQLIDYIANHLQAK